MKQPTLRFYLDGRPNKNGERQIFLDISIGYAEVDFTKQPQQYNSDRKVYKPIKISTLCRIKPENFGSEIQKGTRNVFVFDQKVFNKYSKTNRSIKTRLEQIENVVNEVTNQFYIKQSNPTPKEFKNELELKLGRKQAEVVKEQTVLEYLYRKIENDREAIKLNKKDSLSPNHIKTYVSLSRMFENYHLATKTEIKFSDFNDKIFYWNFFKVVDAIYRGEIEVKNPNQDKAQRKEPTGYGIRSINKYIKLLHRVFVLAKNDGHNITLDLSDKSLSLQTPPAEKEIYLNETELKKIIDSKVPSGELKLAKEYLTMASLMGLRVDDMEDLYKLSPETFKSKKGDFIGVKIKVKKTKSEVIIPLLKPVRDVLNNNQGKFPVFKERAVNVAIKKLCKLLEIDTLEKRTKISFNQGKIVSNDIPKYELISTHDCRRSFITNLVGCNVSSDKIKSITHPKKVNGKDMVALYNKADLVDKASGFLAEIKSIESDIYIYD